MTTPDEKTPMMPYSLFTRLRTLLGNRSVAVLVNLVVMSVTTNLTVILVSSLVEVEQSSIWFACVSASALLFVSDMGISYAVSRHLATLRGTATGGALNDSSRTLLRYFVRTSWLPFIVLSGCLGAYLLKAWGSAGDWHRSTALMTLWAGVSAYSFLATLSKFLQMTNEGLGKLANERLIVSACQTAVFVVVAAYLVLARSITGLPFIYVAGFAVQAAFLYHMARRARQVDHHVPVDQNGLFGLGRESRRLWLLNLATVASQNMQVMALAFLATPTSVATFFFLQRLCGGASNLLGIIPIIDRASITGHIQRGDFTGVRRVIRRNLGIAIISTLVITTAFVVGVLVLDRLQWLRFSIPPLLLAMFAFDLLFSTILGILGQYLLAAGRNPLIPFTIACSALTIGLQFVLVPRYGAYGAIAAFLVAQMLTTYVGNALFFVRLMRDLRRGWIAASGGEQSRDAGEIAFQPPLRGEDITSA